MELHIRWKWSCKKYLKWVLLSYITGSSENRYGPYISAMLSGRLAGMAVRPFPLQSTMLLLQVHMAGQEPPPVLQGSRLEDSWFPGKRNRKKDMEWQETFISNPEYNKM